MKVSKKRGRKPGFKMTEGHKQKLREIKMSPEVTERREKVFNYLMEHGCDLKKRIRRGIAEEIVSALGMKDTFQVIDDIRQIRRQCGITRNPKGSAKEIKATATGLHDFLIANRLFRASLKETPICDKIVRVLHGRDRCIIPPGGVGLLIGTPTPLCLLTKTKNLNSSIIFDNLDVARALLETTQEALRIIIGNAIDKDKANAKAYLWRSFMYCKTLIKTDKIDINSYEYYIKDLLKRYKLVKVILLTSGVWKQTQQSKKKHAGLDLRFEIPSVQLTTKYSGLHILAMCRRASSFDFDLRYLHAGRNIVLNKR